MDLVRQMSGDQTKSKSWQRCLAGLPDLPEANLPKSEIDRFVL